jgi:hypothetical protein
MPSESNSSHGSVQIDFATGTFASSLVLMAANENGRGLVIAKRAVELLQEEPD